MTIGIPDALETSGDQPERHLAKIREGLHDLRGRRTISHQEVSRWLRSWGKKRELSAPSDR